MPYPILTLEEEATGRDAFMRLGALAPDDDRALDYDRMREWRLMWIQKARRLEMDAGRAARLVEASALCKQLIDTMRERAEREVS